MSTTQALHSKSHVHGDEAGRIFRFLQKALPLLSLAIFALAIYFIHHLLKEHSYPEIIGYIRSIPTPRLIAAGVLTLSSYSLLTLYDILGFRYIQRSVPPTKIAFASFTAFAFSNNIGLANVAGSSIRLRIYPTFGLRPADILKVIAFVSSSFWLGFAAIAGLSLTFHPIDLTHPFGIGSWMIRAAGFLFLFLAAAYLVLCHTRRTPFVVFGRPVTLPSLRLGIYQLLVASSDWALVGLVLYLLLPEGSQLSYFQFLSIYISAQLVALMTHVPGGVGVLEALVIYFVSPTHHSSPAVLASLLAFRVIYYILPLITASVMLVGHEISRKRHLVVSVSETALDWARIFLPSAMAVMVFIGGIVLMLSGATPAESERIAELRKLFPLPVLELSHFLASCLGAFLLILARGLLTRSNAAWLLTLLFLIAGAFLSILKGFDYEEATVLFLFAILLALSRDEFHRKAALFTEPFSFSWSISILMTVLGAMWIGLFAHRHIEYDNDLWWTFSFRADAPRSLRASFGILATCAAFGAWRLLHPQKPVKRLPTSSPELVESLAAKARDTTASLALVGDKRIMMSDERDAFIMYAIRGNSWIAMGDPIGNRESFEDLLLDFKELADSYGGQVIFYQVKPENLPLYIDLGLIFLKLGEEARVPLPEFSLEGGSRKNLRQSYTRFRREGDVRFEIVPPEKLDEIFDELKSVSDAWLDEKNAKEKGFSLGHFDRRYLRRFPIAVLRKNETIIAFANILQGANQEELSIDLMRHRPDAPHGTMEALFIDLMLWGRAQGFKWFNLGMAPLSGLETGRYGSRWNRVAKLLYEHGERFYNFRGLRTFKEKFDPAWAPRYLAYPSKLALPLVLADLAILISGSAKGVVTR